MGFCMTARVNLAIIERVKFLRAYFSMSALHGDDVDKVAQKGNWLRFRAKVQVIIGR